MSKQKKKRKPGKTKEQRKAEAVRMAELQKIIKDRLDTDQLNALVASIVKGEDRARREGEKQGVQFAFTLCMLALCDKFGFGKIRLDRLWRCIKIYVDDISAGKLDYELVSKTLDDEYGITVTI